ncbi:MAG: RNA ligase family protein [Thermotogota bacterium]
MEDFKRYHKIKILGDEENKDIFSYKDDCIYKEEKIDGANFRFLINDGKIIFGSRTRQLTSDDGEDGDIDKNFRRCVDYIREQTQDLDLSNHEGYIFYGENCVKHTLSYDWDNIPPFLGFDVYDMKNDRYLVFDDVVNCFMALKLPTVPLIEIVKSSDIKLPIKDKDVPVSCYAPKSNPKQQAEGIVFKNYDKQIFAKYVRDEFKEKNAKVFGGKPKYNKQDDTNNSEIVFKFCTNQRIEKCIFKLLDDGNKLEMKLMEKLPKMVYKDIMEEEWRTICFSKWKVDFKLLNKLFIKRCVAVLKQVIENNMINENV